MNEGIGRSEDNSDSHTDSLFLHEQVPYRLERSLKMVRMNHFYGKSAEVDMVRYLLKNSQVLLVCGHKPSSMEFIELIAKLAKCPRLSTNCELDLVYQLED